MEKMNKYNVVLHVTLDVEIDGVIAEDEESAIEGAIESYGGMTPDEIYYNARVSDVSAEPLDVSLIEENVDEEGNPVEEEEEEDEVKS